MSLRGDPDKLVSEIIAKIIEEYRKTIDQAYNDALMMLEDGYQKIRNELLKSLEETYNKSMDEIKSVKAIKETELKLALSKLRNDKINEALEKAKEKIARLNKRERHKVLKALFNDFYNKTKISNGEIHVTERDVEIMEKVLSEVVKNPDERENFKIIGDLDSELGGFKLVSAEEKVSYDYTLDLLFENMKPELMSLASRLLFGGVEE